jgi:hypothetical protein
MTDHGGTIFVTGNEPDDPSTSLVPRWHPDYKPSSGPPGSKPGRRRRAKRIMIAVTAMCLLLGIAPIADQLIRHGWRAFIARPPGVGASEGNETSEAPVAALPPSGIERRRVPSAAAPRAHKPASGTNTAAQPDIVLVAQRNPSTDTQPVARRCRHRTTYSSSRRT